MDYAILTNKYNQLKGITNQLYYAKLCQKYPNNAKMTWRTIHSSRCVNKSQQL